MDVSSSLTGPKEFRIVKRGYDPDEVDAFLDQISLGVAELKRKLAEADDAAKAAPSASAPQQAATEEVEEIHRALILAQRAADEEVRKATEEAEAIRSEARSAADEVRSAADAQAADARRAVEEEVARRREEGRAGLLSEINELEGIRDSLASDVIVLERHVDEQREVVQAAIGELQSLLDHPEAFRIAMAPGVSTGPALPPRLAADDGPATEPLPLSEVDDGPAPVDEGPTDSAAGDAAPDATAVPEADPEPVATSEPPTDDLQAGPPPVPPASDAPAMGGDPVLTDDPAALPLGSSSAGEDLSPAHDAPVDEPTPPEAPGEARIDLSVDEVVLTDTDDDAGPPTEAMPAASQSESEDAFLAELRKAMLDDEPLGPRDDSDLNPIPAAPEDEPARGRPRFGRRR